MIVMIHHICMISYVQSGHTNYWSSSCWGTQFSPMPICLHDELYHIASLYGICHQQTFEVDMMGIWNMMGMLYGFVWKWGIPLDMAIKKMTIDLMISQWIWRRRMFRQTHLYINNYKIFWYAHAVYWFKCYCTYLSTCIYVYDSMRPIHNYVNK